MATYKRVPLDQLSVDDNYQRPINEAHVKHIAANYSEAMVGALEVSQRNGAGSYTVFDGQHRLEAARLAGVNTVPCLVHKGLAVEQEAEMFVALQQRRKGITSLDRFRARLFFQEPLALAINETVQASGYRISRGGEDSGRLNLIQAVSSLERVQRRGNLAETLALLGDLWGGDDKSTDGGLIEGLSMILERYGHRLNDEPLNRLRAASPLVILRRVIGHSGGGSSKGELVMRELRRIAGLRGALKKKTEGE